MAGKLVIFIFLLKPSSTLMDKGVRTKNLSPTVSKISRQSLANKIGYSSPILFFDHKIRWSKIEEEKQEKSYVIRHCEDYAVDL